MKTRCIISLLLLGLPLSTLAAEPNVRPGKWEYTNTTSFVGTQIPGQTHTSEECVTQADLDRGMTFGDGDLPDDCEIKDTNVSRSEMRYRMTCQTEYGPSEMRAQMRFRGDSMEGQINGEMNTPMGEMKMLIDIKGRHIGNC